MSMVSGGKATQAAYARLRATVGSRPSKSIGRNRTAQPGRLEVYLRGDVGLIDAMNEITSGMVDTIAPAGVRGYLRVVTQGIKNEIPSDMKDARKGVNWRFVKRDKKTDKVVAKAGGQVGFKAARKAKLEYDAVSGRDADRPGVGISVRNIHWFMYGTADRVQETTKRPTGRIKKHQWAAVGAMKSRGQALAKFRELAGKAIEREAKKLRAKGRAQLKAKAAGGAKKAIKGIVRGLT